MANRLKKGALSFFDTLIMSIAGSAPAYSITVSTAALIVAAGYAGPAALWIAAVPMLGITLAFAQLNRWQPDAGAAYVWVGRTMHPALGFLAGWALLSLSTIFNVAAALPAGQATLELAAPGLSHNVQWASAIGALWFLGVVSVVTAGITVSTRTQIALTVFEIAAVILVCGAAIWNARNAPAAPFSLGWFSPTGFPSFQAFSAGMLVALFYYFGWDVSANLAEETAKADWSAGLACIFGVAAVVAMFLLAQVAAQVALSPSDIEAHSGSLLPALGAAALPAPWSAIAVLAILVSTVATIETQLLQCTRLLFSMARDRVIGESMGNLHPRYQTPWLAGIAVAGVTLCLFAASAAFPSAGALMTSLINAIGVQVACYYALAGFACAWHFRKAEHRGTRSRVYAVIIPLLSALFVAGIGIYQLPFLGWRVASLSIGTILIGVVPYFFYRWRYRGYFLARDDPV